MINQTVALGIAALMLTACHPASESGSAGESAQTKPGERVMATPVAADARATTATSPGAISATPVPAISNFDAATHGSDVWRAVVEPSGSGGRKATIEGAIATRNPGMSLTLAAAAAGSDPQTLELEFKAEQKPGMWPQVMGRGAVQFVSDPFPAEVRTIRIGYADGSAAELKLK